MNNVAAIKWTLGKVKELGAGLTLAQLDQSLPTESLVEIDRQDCREWLDNVLAQQGPEYRAVEALVLKLTTIGPAIGQRLNQAAVERLSVEEISRLMMAYLDFKQVIEEVVPKK